MPKKQVKNRQFRDINAVKRELAKVYNEYKAKKLKQSEAHELTYILKTLLTACQMIWEQRMIHLELNFEKQIEGLE